MLDTDILRAGLRAGEAGRAAGVYDDGEGFVGGRGFEFECCRSSGGTGGAVAPADVALGVGCGVDEAEFALATDIGVGVCLVLDGG